MFVPNRGLVDGTGTKSRESRKPQPSDENSTPFKVSRKDRDSSRGSARKAFGDITNKNSSSFVAHSVSATDKFSQTTSQKIDTQLKKKQSGKQIVRDSFDNEFEFSSNGGYIPEYEYEHNQQLNNPVQWKPFKKTSARGSKLNVEDSYIDETGLSLADSSFDSIAFDIEIAPLEDSDHDVSIE